MNSLAKIVVGILAAIGALYVGTMIFSFIVDPCHSQYLVALDSPDQERTAFVTLSSCPDNPDTELSVYVYRREDPGRQHGAVLTSNPATTEIYLEWSADRSLVLRHSAALEIVNRPSSLADVDIRFEPVDR